MGDIFFQAEVVNMNEEDRISSVIKESPFLLVNGGLGTQLIYDGYDIADDPLWSARLLYDNPEAITHVHLRQLESGSDVAVTASYQASVEDFCKYLGVTPKEAEQLIKRSVALARDACTKFWEKQPKTTSALSRLKPLVAGSVGPYGACQHDGSEYSGDYVDTMTVENLMEWHRPRMRALVDAGVDLLAIETIPAQKEAEALAVLLKEFPGTKALLSFSCKDGLHTSHGEQLITAVLSVLKHTSQVVAVGINCCSPLFVKSLLLTLKDKVSLPLVAYPHIGEEWIDKRCQFTGQPVKIKDLVPDWISAGAQWIGGCCETRLSDIQSIRQILDSQ
ncbi:uncharacterized protein LOC116304048 isoform X2 [Actinia tenebrosa]|uniref:Uncharacterized protein LOC116304048 isoform X2 n=1 Tax=Actinia tenebrosa TaxID=6105 RepID=A0A6P8ITN7_ACTTE|nr:uncharacterized protein LOC116304048 isoform X2 [Actinia tenebrosa]